MSTPSKLNDEEILRRIVHRDALAFQNLYAYHTPAIRSYLTIQGVQEADILEIEQEVIIHLFEKCVEGSFHLHKSTKLSTYLYGVGKKAWINKNRKSKKYEYTQEVLDTEDVTVDDEEEFSEKSQKVQDVFPSLSVACQKVLTMYYYERKSMKEISELVGDPNEDTTRKRKYKCLQRIKMLIK